MKRKTRKTLRFTAEHATNALQILIADGKIAAKDVSKALKRREAMIRELRARLAALETGVASRIASVGKGLTRKVRRKPRLSAATRAKYKQQGRYMASVRRLSKKDRARVKTIREKSGVVSAIREAKRLAS